mgnify:CR=1 FL=1
MQLALPSRDYYLKPNSNVELRAYHKYMTQIAILLGADEKTAEAELEDVIKFEVRLANVGTFYKFDIEFKKNMICVMYTFFLKGNSTRS